MKKINNNCSIALRICFLILGSLFFPTFLTSFLFIFKINISWFQFPISIFCLIFIYTVLFYNKDDKKKFYFPLIIWVLIQFVILLVCNCFFEYSWDGWSYHLPAIIELKNGWNPLYNHNESIGIWSVHYPKFIWIYAANLYKITGNMFLGISFNFGIIASIFFLSFDILRRLKKTLHISILTSFIIAFNVIAIGNLFSYYNDGTLGICIWGLLLSFYAISKKLYPFEKNMPILLIITFFASILANIKYNGALFAFIIVFCYYIYLFIKKIILINKHTLISAMIIGIGVLVVASNTYLVNMIHHNNVGYPIMGENKIDIITNFVPDMLKDSGRFESLIKSLTFDSGIDIFQDNIEYKYHPFFLVSKESISCAVSTDCRMGGFGPFYQSVIILFLTICVISIFRFVCSKSFSLRVVKTNLLKYIDEFMIIVLILLITLFIPALWWARYISYLYILPAVLLVVFKKEWKNCQIQTVFSRFVIFILICSSGIYLCTRVKQQYVITQGLKRDINEIFNNSDNGSINISLYNTSSNYYKEKVRNELLIQYGITINSFNEDNDCEIIKKYSSIGSSILSCESKKEG